MPTVSPSAVPEPLAVAQQVADFLGTTVDTLANWRYRGVGPRFVKVGGIVRYRWSDVNAWVESRVAQRTDDIPTEAAS